MPSDAMNTDEPSPLWSKNEKPLSCDWITDDLLRNTQEAWSEAYGRPISRDEAVEMLLNVKRLGEALREISPKLREDGPAEPPPEEELPQDVLSVMYRHILRMGLVKLPEQPHDLRVMRTPGRRLGANP